MIKLQPFKLTIRGFDHVGKSYTNTIALSIIVGPCILDTLFHVMPKNILQNSIIRHPWLHAMKVILSNLYR